MSLGAMKWETSGDEKGESTHVTWADSHMPLRFFLSLDPSKDISKGEDEK